MCGLETSWAFRSIVHKLNACLAAKTMGHSLSVHYATCHRWLEQSDVEAIARGMQGGG